jgi:hypothetical protein
VEVYIKAEDVKRIFKNKVRLATYNDSKGSITKAEMEKQTNEIMKGLSVKLLRTIMNEIEEGEADWLWSYSSVSQLKEIIKEVKENASDYEGGPLYGISG